MKKGVEHRATGVKRRPLRKGGIDVNETTTTDVAETTPEKIERKVTELRDDLSDIVGDEWGKRGQELVALRRQLEEHPEWLATAALAIGGTALWLGVSAWRRRNRRRPLARMEALRDLILRVVEHPEAVIRSRSPFTRKLVMALGNTAANLLIAEVAKRFDLDPRAYRARA